MSGLIIEGVCATGKSTILNRLTRRDKYINRYSKLQLSEHLTERVIENINPTIEQRVELLNGYVKMLEAINNTFYTSRFKDTKLNEIKPCYLFERFHLTHSVEVSSLKPFKAIDERLSNLGFKVITLTMDKEVIMQRLEDTFKRRNKLWYNYVMSFGGLEGASERYSKMQDALLAYTKETSLPVKVINTTDMKWDDYIQSIESFWGI